MQKYRLAIVIPAYNEEATIAKVINSVNEYGHPIVVNDSSTDDTNHISKALGATVVSHKYNKGYDEALNTGFQKAEALKYDGIITFDADGQHSITVLAQYREQLEKGVDLVLGIRPKTQRYAEWIFKMYTKFFMKWSDPLCGMKGYSMRLYKAKGKFDSVGSIGTELAAFGINNGYEHIEIRVPQLVRKYGRPRFGSAAKSNFIILKAFFRMIANRKI
jgi:glycosyltransferase involved in cell wall biosynthesis